VDYSADLGIGHETLDSQHQLLFGLIADLQHEIEAAPGKPVSTDILQRLFMYVVVHFSTEDRLMMESDYPDIAAHRAEHEAVVANLKRLEADCQAGVPSAPQDTMRFLKAWVEGHIPNADRRLAQHLSKERGSANNP
jgi:hemerythrin-like metal-binding protein